MSRNTVRRSRTRRGRVRKTVLLAVGALAAGAVIQELSTPKEQRTWHGRVLGVPYDFRFPSAARMEQTMWAPDDARLLMPKSFGLGWDLNVGRIVHLLSNQPGTG